MDADGLDIYSVNHKWYNHSVFEFVDGERVMTEWISVEGRLPDKEVKSYIVYVDSPNMNDRIKLAEAMDTTRLIMAMGWTPAEDHSNNPEWRSMWFSPEGSGPQPRPNPYKDANFDYAVLEWAYGQGEVFALK